MASEGRRVCVKVFLSSYVQTLTKEVDASKQIAVMKLEILRHIKYPGDGNDCELVLVSSGGSLIDEDTCRVLRDNDFIVLCKKNSFPTVRVNNCTANIGASYYDLCELQDYPVDKRQILQLDGESLNHEVLVAIGLRKYQLKLSDKAIANINQSRKVVDDTVKSGKVVYGLTTGFGAFKNKVIEKDQVKELQKNLITSHSCGVGSPLSQMRTRMVLALRINVLAKGYSGIRQETMEKMIQALNADCLPYIPEKGSVGASGDLAPLSHLALGLMGQGEMWSQKTGWGPANEVLKANNLTLLELEAKEGLALNNGTQVITALGAEALYRAEMIAKQADVIAALTAEVLEGVPEQFCKDVHDVRPHPGQKLVAARLRHLMHASNSHMPDAGKFTSDIIKSRIDRESASKSKKVQDPYSIRCVPQVHGVVHEIIAFVKHILTTEINSVTDNPMVMINREIPETASAGNFHGEYPGKSLDQIAIAIHEIANISERRIERLVHPDYIKEPIDFPGFLVGGKDLEGLNNGFMIMQYTAAALVSENKVLTHPSTVDSITTSGGSEDHVSMGTYAARKALTVVENVEHVLAIELLANCQALDFQKSRSKSTTAPLEKVYHLVRENVPKLQQDRFMSPDIASVVRLLQEGKIWDQVKDDLPESAKCGITISCH